MTPEEERGRIEHTVVSPDLWNRRQDTGKSGVETFIENGVDGILKADHRRVPMVSAARVYNAVPKRVWGAWTRF